MIYRMSAWTGPTTVKTIAAALLVAGLKAAWDGTEHVYWNAEGKDAIEAFDLTMMKLKTTFGTSFGLKVTRAKETSQEHAKQYEKLAETYFPVYEKFYPKEQ